MRFTVDLHAFGFTHVIERCRRYDWLRARCGFGYFGWLLPAHGLHVYRALVSLFVGLFTRCHITRLIYIAFTLYTPLRARALRTVVDWLHVAVAGYTRLLRLLDVTFTLRLRWAVTRYTRTLRCPRTRTHTVHALRSYTHPSSFCTYAVSRCLWIITQLSWLHWFAHAVTHRFRVRVCVPTRTFGCAFGHILRFS